MKRFGDHGTQLLLTLCRRGLTDPAPQLPRVTATAWRRAIDGAERLGLAGWIFAEGLRGDLDRDHGGPPAAQSERLLQLYRRDAALNARRLSELGEIVGPLSGKGIKTVVLKGSALACDVYENVGARAMRDLDLLVREENLSDVDSLLRKRGYSIDESFRPAGWYWRNHHHLAPYVSGAHGCCVEVHRHIVVPSAPFRIGIDALWRRAEPACVAGRPALTLAPEDLLLHLSIHTAWTDAFAAGLRGLVDIAMTIRRYSRRIAWRELAARARDWQAERELYYSFTAARTLLHLKLPHGLLEGLRAHVPGSRPGVGLARTLACRAAVRACRPASRLDRLSDELEARVFRRSAAC